MNAESLTSTLHRKSDEELKKHINSMLLPLFEEAKSMPYNDLKKANPDDWLPFKDKFWIGEAMTTYRDLAFLYLRDHWRQKKIQDFISKVEEIEQLTKSLNEHDHS